MRATRGARARSGGLATPRLSTFADRSRPAYAPNGRSVGQRFEGGAGPEAHWRRFRKRSQAGRKEVAWARA